ncbi:MAG TPA: hypothetical protein VGZ49_06315 [Xanthobacteraceae bacterium]|jgi:hypothetical protein|nr:hypothetical protein [Xanthobacteraceae bacterium]
MLGNALSGAFNRSNSRVSHNAPRALRSAELNDARGTLLGRQAIFVHFLKQGFFFGCQVQALARKRSPHAGTTAADFRKLRRGEPALLSHLFPVKYG